MVVGRLTRDSVRHALYNGITALQIVEFLSKHVHKQMKMNMKSGKSVLPENVMDQIYLWEVRTITHLTYYDYCYCF